jgi:hypothetical protein
VMDHAVLVEAIDHVQRSGEDVTPYRVHQALRQLGDAATTYQEVFDALQAEAGAAAEEEAEEEDDASPECAESAIACSATTLIHPLAPAFPMCLGFLGDMSQTDVTPPSQTWPRRPLPQWGVKPTNLNPSSGRCLPQVLGLKYLKCKTRIWAILLKHIHISSLNGR